MRVGSLFSMEESHAPLDSDADEPPGSGNFGSATEGLQVLVANHTTLDVDANSLALAAQQALGDGPFEAGELSIAVVDDDTIHRLNRSYLAHDYATDVLSFPLLVQPPRLEGEVVVSIDTAGREALAAGWTVQQELMLYVVHGTLHLKGFCDKQPDDADRMREAERAVLAELGVSPSSSDSRWSRQAGVAEEGAVEDAAE